MSTSSVKLLLIYFNRSDNGTAFHKPHTDLVQSTRTYHTTAIQEMVLFAVLSSSFVSAQGKRMTEKKNKTCSVTLV